MKLKARKANITLYINIKYEICLSKYLSLRIIFQFSQRSGKSSSNARMTKPNSWKRMINCFTCGLDQRRSPSPSEQTQQKPTSTRISKYVFLFSRAETDSPESDICKQAQIFFLFEKKTRISFLCLEFSQRRKKMNFKSNVIFALSSSSTFVCRR